MSGQPATLIVDDELEILRATSIRLSAAGFVSISTCEGNSVLPLAVKHRPQAIVLDVRMPAKDGLTLLAELRSHPKTGMIPVIMLSASIVDQQAALDGGATFFVRKPYEGMQLVQAITTAIARGAEKRRATQLALSRGTTPLAARAVSGRTATQPAATALESV